MSKSREDDRRTTNVSFFRLSFLSAVAAVVLKMAFGDECSRTNCRLGPAKRGEEERTAGRSKKVLTQSVSLGGVFLLVSQLVVRGKETWDVRVSLPSLRYNSDS